MLQYLLLWGMIWEYFPITFLIIFKLPLTIYTSRLENNRINFILKFGEKIKSIEGYTAKNIFRGACVCVCVCAL